jgi:bifunctional enzyme CysN/CysC/sulfate adenylyltransferase subunit 1
VQTVLRHDATYRGFAGQIASGTVKPGDGVVVLPSGRHTRIASVDSFDGPMAEARVPSSIAVRLADDVDVSRGDLLADPAHAPTPLQRFDATLVWFSDRALDSTRRYLVKHTTRTVPAQVEAILWRKDLETLAEVPAQTLAQNDIALVRIVTKRPLLCDPYHENRRTGAFIVIDAQTNETVAAGMIRGAADDPDESEELSQVSAEERRLRLGQRGVVVVVPKGARAALLERRLFDRGHATSLVRGDFELAESLAEAGLVALLHGRSDDVALHHAGAPLLPLDPNAGLDAWLAAVEAEITR